MKKQKKSFESSSYFCREEGPATQWRRAVIHSRDSASDSARNRKCLLVLVTIMKLKTASFFLEDGDWGGVEESPRGES
jgi:hypothetical protein